MARGLLPGVLVVASVGVLAFLAIAWRPALPPIEPPLPASLPADVVARGEMLAGAGSCATCHTTHGGERFAGGQRFPTRFGVIYSPNITPDREAGIGRWSEAAFVRAMREGVSRDGSHLYPVFPFDHFARLSDADIKALYAYLMTVPPAKARPLPNDIAFPFRIRTLMAAWKGLYLEAGPYRPNPTRSPEWNRGAYLVEGLAHCGSCHTPRNILGAEQVGHPLSGSGLIDGWLPPPLDFGVSPARWTREEYVTYLRGGTTRHGRAIGPMMSVVRGLDRLPDSDIHAIAAFMADFSRPAANNADTLAAKAERTVLDGASDHPGAELYARSCGSCHGGRGARSDLALSTAIWLDIPHNFTRAVLDGVAGDGRPGPTMPAFRDSLSDRDVADIGDYLRRSYTGRQPWVSLVETIRQLRNATTVPPLPR